ncbi:hypothetical protein GCM10027289_12230 [Tsukamurella serpentis]
MSERPGDGVQTGGRHSTVLPGDRVVARVRSAILVVDAPALDAAEAAELAAAIDVPGDLAPVLAAHTGVPFAVVEVTESTARAMLRGLPETAPDQALTVAIFTSASAATPLHVLTAEAGFIERVAPLEPGAVVTVTVGPPPSPGPVCGPTALHLLRGAVPGAGAVLWTEESVAPNQADIVTETTDGETLAEVRAEARVVDGAVRVEGKRCAFGHLNAPHLAYCARCGALVDRRAPVEVGPRPALATLIAEDGTSFPVQTDLVIGRDPAGYVAQRAGRSFDGAGGLLPITLQDRTGALSRVHLEIRVDGWQLLAVDAGSANGTWIRPPSAAAPLRLFPGRPVPVAPGTEIHLGGRILRLQEFVHG